MLIENIKITNFRSIKSISIPLKNLNIFVGNNDAGKSNILKAINLFFTNETMLGVPFNFEADFSHHAEVKKQKAKEIVIELTLRAPDTFKSEGRLVWRKVWRSSGIHIDGERMRYEGGSDLTTRSRVRTWLRRIGYHYVPAIKGREYFSSLLTQLHDVLSMTVDAKLKTASTTFVSKIREQTQSITDDIYEEFNFQSQLQLPSNLADLFSTLEFETSTAKKPVSLQNRGDGIKARHIPAILNFFAQKERLYHPRGAVRRDSIWGYEEPENNLEMTHAFRMAGYFIERSKEIQIFLTTHSPAFYSAIHTETAQGFIVKQINSETKVEPIDPSESQFIDVHMGLLPIITPYVEKEKERARSYKDELDKLQAERNDTPVLMVEGITDKQILDSAWLKLNGPKKAPFRIEPQFDRFQLQNLFSREEIFINHPKRQFIALFDFDIAYENWLKLLKKEGGVWKQIESDDSKSLTIRHSKHPGHALLLPVPPHRRNYANILYGISSALTIELLFTDDVLNGFVDQKTCPGDTILMKIKDDKKVEFSKHISGLGRESFGSFVPLFDKIISLV